MTDSDFLKILLRVLDAHLEAMVIVNLMCFPLFSSSARQGGTEGVRQGRKGLLLTFPDQIGYSVFKKEYKGLVRERSIRLNLK